MLNTKKLLYLFPDVALVAELLPAKKPNTFGIQSFRQINGEYMTEDELHAGNIVKLFSKLESESYQLILPDFLFTNTIVTVAATGDKKVADHLEKVLLPSLDLSEKTHAIQSFVLTELKGESKVQLSAIEKSVLAPIRAACSRTEVSITGFLPVSWTLKSVISLEPSISVIQVGGHLYSALHYIGVDQTNHTSIEESSVVAETIKTLKGAEPSIQTLYLISNAVVQEKLDEDLKKILPVQQLSEESDEEDKLPSYTKVIIESGMKTLSIEDFMVPKFKLAEASDEDLESLAANEEAGDNEEAGNNEEAGDEEGELPKPVVLGPASTASGESDIENAKPEEGKEEAPVSLSQESPTTDLDKKPILSEDEGTASNEVDLAKFARHSESEATKPAQTAASQDVSETIHKPKVVLKNKSGVGTMVKMIVITLVVFAITVAVGIGVGLGLLKFTGQGTGADETTPVVVTTPSPATIPSPSPSPSPSPIDKAAVSILVVNATTTAGYAGTTSTALENNDFEKVSAGNAQGDYEPGFYLLLDEENPGLVSELTTASGLDLEVVVSEEEKAIEDSADAHDAVIVLAE